VWRAAAGLGDGRGKGDWVILVDTSVWADHLRRANPRLQALLADAAVLGHPFVTGELALGHLRQPAIIVALLNNLPQAVQATHEEALHFVTENRLPGTGVGWVDVHLLCSAALAHSRIWTLDRRLAVQASRLGLGEGA
jgi:predicted nucleic acid-binding protein